MWAQGNPARPWTSPWVGAAAVHTNPTRLTAHTLRPCLPATIPVFQLFDAPRADGTHPLTRSFASPKELIDESDVLSPLWGVFPLTAARGLPQELHTLLGMCLRVAMAKSGMLREPCGALWGVVLLGPQLGQHGRPAVADDGVFSLPSRCAGAQKTWTSPTYHSVFQRSAPEQTLAVHVTFSFCGFRMMLRVSVNAERWDCQLGRLPTTRSRKVL